jgi:adenylate cyclase
MGLEMLAIVDGYTTGPFSRIQIRIGINIGPVTAGVIGKQKFVYDVYGDTVNTASRMESQGVPGWIQVTEATYRRLQWDYCLEPRGQIEVKGKGEMVTYWYWLRRRRDERRTA